METSAYTPLQGPRAIRLLSLSPSQDPTAKLRCTIEAVSLDDMPNYEALSWEWGDAKITETIMLNNLQHNVPKNLAEGLRQYRQTDERRLFWADAICVNQADLLERSEQICLMCDIYRQATVVQVWLGPMLSGEGPHLFSIFERMAQGTSIKQLYYQELVGSVAIPTSLGDSPETYAPDDATSNPDISDAINPGWFFGKLLRFFELGWWNRLWPLQEFVLAQTVLLRWGIKTITITTLFDAHDSIKADLQKDYNVAQSASGRSISEEYLDAVAGKLGLIQYLRSLQPATEHVDPGSKEQLVYSLLIETLALCRSRESSDPRDKIYGLLGMLPLEVSLEIRPSYLQPEKLVFSDLACLILRMTKSFMLFSWLGQNDDTWIPEFNRPRFYSNDFHARVNQQELFSAGAGGKWELSIAADNVLHLKGVRIDELDYAESTFSFESVDAFRLHAITDRWCMYFLFQDRARPSTYEKVREYVRRTKYPDVSTLGDAMCRTLLNDCVPLTESGKLLRARDEDTRDVQEWILYMESLSGGDQMGSPAMAYSEGLRFRSGCKEALCETIRNNIRGKGFIRTKLGYIGLVQEDVTRAGDEVWILAGASHPVILRPIDAERNTYKAVTEAYVQGIMDVEISRGRCPILPSDGSAESIIRQYTEGRTSWPVPDWTDIRIL